MKFVEPHVVVSLRPALLVEVDPEDENRVDELRVAEVVPAEVVLRTDWIDPRGSRARRPAAERHAHDLSRKAALDELGARRAPAVQPRVVERAFLEAGALRRDLAHVRAIELARHE